MMNLFSQFNPITTNHTSMNWLMIVSPMMMSSMMFWHIKSNLTNSTMKLNSYMSAQFKTLLKKKTSHPNALKLMTIMMSITYLNISGLMPHTFSASSHMSLNLSMASTLWTMLMIKKLKNIKKLMTSLTPTNTPVILVPFMVMIELISMTIQPMTLAIRLSANVMAGHIMMTLISEMYKISFSSALLMNMMIMIMELGVSIIQAYVFSMLIIMYKK